MQGSIYWGGGGIPPAILILIEILLKLNGIEEVFPEMCQTLLHTVHYIAQYTYIETFQGRGAGLRNPDLMCAP